ncbi:DUF1697 domain-containing protein [Cohnella sp. CFH 77786]|uniref:DUF1697 domain-containing protein n=1 Tax=Cohnella sp. CFH 77786 TaxID=2662265 RepID=UPI001C60B74C|nr:DUF1697 domain-containing protein [Cohnella sp. CFH 77786]MBW5446742.1 DUF1697 domain-containing protein [Cohnella sp. CFH 77786]
MSVHAALLRGINVGGNKKVSMPALKQMFEKMGFERVQTYINSGNVLFVPASAADPGEMAGRIEKEIEREFGFPAAVILRTGDDLGRIIRSNPFAGEGTPEELNLHVGFLSQLPSESQLDRIRPYVTEDDRFRLVDHELYVMFRAGVRDSKLGNSLNKLGVPVTLRNWNTTNKLFALAEAMKA